MNNFTKTLHGVSIPGACTRMLLKEKDTSVHFENHPVIPSFPAHFSSFPGTRSMLTGSKVIILQRGKL